MTMKNKHQPSSGAPRGQIACTYRLDRDNIFESIVFPRVRQIHTVVMIQRSLTEFDLNVVTAQFDNLSFVPVFSALDADGLYVLGRERTCPTT